MKTRITLTEWDSVYWKYWDTKKHYIFHIDPENCCIHVDKATRPTCRSGYVGSCYFGREVFSKYLKKFKRVQDIIKQEIVLSSLSDSSESIYIVVSPSGKHYQVIR